MISTRNKVAFASIGVVLLSAAYFVPSAYRKAQMDKEVDRLCALDGGVKVFEKISLPAESFDRFGHPNVPLSTSKAAQSSAFVVDAIVVELVKGDPYGMDRPSLHKFTSKAIRLSDGKVLGIAVGYYRFGGDPDGPWHPSNYTGCTSEPGEQVIGKVFSRAPKELP